jgi:fatty acid desaturase
LRHSTENPQITVSTAKDSIVPLHLLSPSEYVRTIRPHLPSEAFRRRPVKLAIALLHILFICVGYLAIRSTSSPVLWLGISLVIGHSLACLAFFAHTLSHGAVLKRGHLRYFLEILFWGFNCMPATIWQTVHNRLHHVHTHTANDPDRPFRQCETTCLVRLYNRVFMPNATGLRWRPSVWLNFTTYVIRHIVATATSQYWIRTLKQGPPSYSPSEHLKIALECAYISGFQILVFLIVGDWERYLFASPIALAISSGIVTIYNHTNHFLNPLCSEVDPVLGTTSVQVPHVFDIMHDNFSYHTEHHLFPSLDPSYYPAVCRLIEEHYPERYNRLPIAVAWQRLWDQGEFVKETNQAPHSTPSPNQSHHD